MRDKLSILGPTSEVISVERAENNGCPLAMVDLHLTTDLHMSPCQNSFHLVKLLICLLLVFVSATLL